MKFTPIDLMQARVSRYGADSDSALFHELLYAGEFILKISTAAMVSAVQEDREAHKYRLLHGLVRADGLGDWSRSLDEVLIGPASQLLASEFAGVRRVFTERLGAGAWQYHTACDLHDVLSGITDNIAPLGDKVALRAWFQSFSELRNKTRGHGALTPATCSKLVAKLKNSIDLLCENNPIFKLSWAFLYRNLSGKYNVAVLGGDPEVFRNLKSAAAVAGENLPNGVYLWAGRYRRVELVHTDLNASDFFLPNGAFRNGSYELHSLITDNRLKGDASPFLAVATDRPPSETEGKGELDVLGRVFSNLPVAAANYVRRPQLEANVLSAIMNDRHPIVTLVGRGGTGKTSLALAVLREVAETDRYEVVLWFSARDIDLMMSGAKPVQPRVLTDREIAEEYRSLIGHTDGANAKTDTIAFMGEHLRQSPLGPTLFVFDNFETVRSPVDLFNWIDTNIRLPNKAVITTRFRDFKADYPIEVSGMERTEAEVLIRQTAIELNIVHFIGKDESDVIIEDSSGHPYIIKITLGEVANAGRFSKPINLIAKKDDLLDALFERTYANLSPIASRIFLTLSGWRSIVPQLAVEAVLLRHQAGGDPEAGIDQLVRMSLVERTSADDGTDFLQVPLAGALFGKRKLEVSPDRTVIENDIRFLQEFGATAVSGLRQGIRPRVEAFFRKAARSIIDGSASMDEVRPLLEFLARGHPPTWLLLSKLEQEVFGQPGVTRASEYVRRYLETQPPATQAQAAWEQLLSLYRMSGDVVGGCGAFLKAADLIEPTMDDVSAMANWLNNATEVKEMMDVSERSQLFRPLARLMEARLAQASATDLSRLAWLHLHSGEERRALEVAELGLRREPSNIYCARLVKKLTNPY